MLSKLKKGALALTMGATLLVAGAALADGPEIKTKSRLSSPAARSSADLEASVVVANNQNLAPWTVVGTVKNVGGHDWTGTRTVTLYQVITRRGVGGYRTTSIKLASTTVTSLKAGKSITLSKKFDTQPANGARFELLISPGDVNPANDRAEITFRGT